MDKETLELLREARDHLRHTRCIDDDATKCPACSIEARIDRALSSQADERTLVYLACPYSHQERSIRVARFEAANRASGELMHKGMHVFSPISHTHPIAEACDLPLGWDFWHAYNRAILEHCSRVIVLQVNGWQASKGVMGEISIATEMGISVEYMPAPPTNTAAGIVQVLPLPPQPDTVTTSTNTAAGNGAQIYGRTDSRESHAVGRCQSAVPADEDSSERRVLQRDPRFSVSKDAAPQESVKETGREIGDTPAVAAPLTLPDEPPCFVFEEGGLHRIETYNALRSVAQEAIERMEKAEARLATKDEAHVANYKRLIRERDEAEAQVAALTKPTISAERVREIAKDWCAFPSQGEHAIKQALHEAGVVVEGE